MKVALVMAHLSSASGGIAESVRGLAGALVRAGVEATVVGLVDPASPEEWQAWGSGVRAVPAFRPRSFGWAPAMAETMFELAPDVADTQHLWMYPSIAVGRWARARKGPHLVTPRGMLDSWALARSRVKKWVAWHAFQGRHLASARCIRALNASEFQAIRRIGLPSPIAIVPNGVALPVLSPKPPRAEKTLLFLSRIDPKKGVHELLRGWAAAQAWRSGWRLLLTGWGPESCVAATKRLAHELGLDETVEFTGPRFGEAKDATFRGADAFILPSYSEGLPMAVLEAWSYALPVLMTRACNLPEGFEGGAAIEIGTEPERIAEGIRTLVALRDAEREAMGATGRRLVEQRYTWPEVARQMIEVYRWVLGGGPPPACVVTD